METPDLLRAKPAGEHATVRVESPGVHARGETRRPRPFGEGFARVEEALESLAGAIAGKDRRELHVAIVTARLAARSTVAHGHSLQRHRTAQQNGVAEPLGVHGTDLALEVESRKDPVGQRADLFEEAPSSEPRSSENSAYSPCDCRPAAFVVTSVSAPGQKPCFW